MKLRYLVATIFIILSLLFGFAIGFVTGVCEPTSIADKPILCKVETTGIGTENRIFARTAEGEVYSWYQDDNAPAAFYIIALNRGRVVNAFPIS